MPVPLTLITGGEVRDPIPLCGIFTDVTFVAPAGLERPLPLVLITGGDERDPNPPLGITTPGALALAAPLLARKSSSAGLANPDLGNKSIRGILTLPGTGRLDVDNLPIGSPGG